MALELAEYLQTEAEARCTQHRPHLGTCPDCPEYPCALCEGSGVVGVEEVHAPGGAFNLSGWYNEVQVPCPACRGEDAALPETIVDWVARAQTILQPITEGGEITDNFYDVEKEAMPSIIVAVETMVMHLNTLPVRYPGG